MSPKKNYGEEMKKFKVLLIIEAVLIVIMIVTSNNFSLRAVNEIAMFASLAGAVVLIIMFVKAGKMAKKDMDAMDDESKKF